MGLPRALDWHEPRFNAIFTQKSQIQLHRCFSGEQLRCCPWPSPFIYHAPETFWLHPELGVSIYDQAPSVTVCQGYKASAYNPDAPRRPKRRERCPTDFKAPYSALTAKEVHHLERTGMLGSSWVVSSPGDPAVGPMAGRRDGKTLDEIPTASSTLYSTRTFIN